MSRAQEKELLVESAMASTEEPSIPVKSGYKSVQYETHMKNEATSSISMASSFRNVKYRLYRWRWFMFLALCFVNISNGMMWLTFAPIPDYTAIYYGVTIDAVNWFSTSFFLASLLIGLVSIYILDRFGLKVTVYLGAALNVVGGVLRVISTIEGVICTGTAGYVVAMIGQVLTAAAQPFLLYAPTTLASIWFGPNERAVATGISSLANPVGLAVVQLASAFIVTSAKKVPLMLLIYAIPAVLSFLMILVAFWYKEPPLPPTLAAERDHIPSFIRGLAKIICVPSFWVLLVVWGCASGMFNALITILPQVLCPHGYSDKDSGLWGSLMILCGMIGAVAVGIILDRTKLFKEVAVVTYSCAILSFVFFYEAFSWRWPPVVIAISLCVFGFFALPLIPACMELGVEITYPVSEVTSSGLLWSAAQVMGIVIVTIGSSSLLEVPLGSDLVPLSKCSTLSYNGNSTCPNRSSSSHNSSAPYDLTPSMELYDLSYTIIFCMALTVANFLFFIICFWPKLRRLESERRSNLEKSIVVNSN